VTERLAVVGGDAAGMSAASQARRRKGPDELEIVAFERGGYTSYSACGIPYYIAGVVDDFDSLITRWPEEFRSRQSIDVRIRSEVLAIDLDRRSLRARTEDGAEVRESFDRLVVATGSVPLRPALPGIDTPGIFGVQVLDDGRAVSDWITERRPAEAVVVGGGYIGLEMAEAFKTRGMDVAIVEMGPHPMATLDPEMGMIVAEAARNRGITVHTEESVTGFESSGGRIRAVETDRRTLPADVVVLGLGVRPSVEVARDAGVPIGSSGGIAVDERMRTGVEGVWAAGDCAEKFHRIARRPVTIPLGTHANKEGRVAGIDIGGGNATFPGVLGTAVSKICDVEIGRTGLGEDEARAAGFDVGSVLVDSRTRAGYYPDGQPIKIKLVVEERSDRLLGGQIVGREGAAKRIDLLATALWNGMTVGEIIDLDLSYAPPFSPVWDPVLIAARKAWERNHA